ncbi:MAG: DUF1824 family protein [Candidatus Parcubacteria bacterium]|nr:DUF1824 family protein [Leptolyngbyaceae cyanobacterium LF-bin-113]
MSSQVSSLTIQTAQELLRQFICLDREPSSPELDYATVREALFLMVDRSDYQIFGICADNASKGQQALHSYLAALQRDERPEVQATTDDAVYVKYNPKTGLCRAEPYTGNHRGVLVSCQSAYDDDINETFGHLPIDLFEG